MMEFRGGIASWVGVSGTYYFHDANKDTKLIFQLTPVNLFKLEPKEHIYSKKEMKEIIFRCDNCNTILSNMSESKPHIAFQFDKGRTGIATPPRNLISEDVMNWSIIPFSKFGIMQFCNPKCVYEFLERKYNEAMMKLLKV